jgi:pyridinium-3,5-bisthiocarboxylic acid mononucleotide nickel chelatase
VPAKSARQFLYIDPSSAGISGNMIVGALLDSLPASRCLALVREFKRVFTRKGFHLKAREVRRHGFRGFHIDAPDLHLDTHHLSHEVERAARSLHLSPPARAFAHAVVDLILDLEGEVHGTPRDDVHLHEIASFDTVFDATAGARALEAVGVFEQKMEVFARPVEVGSGTVTFSHGRTAVPPPVSELLLHRFQIPFTQHADREVATPTGLAMLALLSPRFEPPPASVLVARGAGAGSWELTDRPNLLVVQVRSTLEGARSRPVHDPVAQLEVSLDDVEGETAGHALTRAMEEGAIDAHVVATLTKKGRPGHMLFVLTREEDAERIADVLANETGSWGVRIAHRVARFKAVPRQMTVGFELGGRRFSARVKYLAEGGRVVRVKPEYDDLAKAARIAGATLAEARAAAEAAARERLERGPKRGKGSR